ncbi:hypothetical protein SDJN02_19432, partial [Cucurbita argyrosperma subsp. argyrosperma]
MSNSSFLAAAGTKVGGSELHGDSLRSFREECTWKLGHNSTLTIQRQAASNGKIRLNTQAPDGSIRSGFHWNQRAEVQQHLKVTSADAAGLSRRHLLIAQVPCMASYYLD